MGISVGDSMLLCQPSRCRPPLDGHELLRRLVAVLCLERRDDRPQLHGGLFRLRVRRQLGEELLIFGVLLIALRWSWLLQRHRRQRWGRWWWWRAGSTAREHGVGCEEAARHVYRQLEDGSLAARRRAFYSRKRAGKRRRRGGKRRDGIHFTPTCAPTQQLAAPLQSCCCLQRHYSGREMRRVETTKRRGQSLTVGHAMSHAPSRRPRLPPAPLPVDRVWIGCAR
jgi:hypothetical protein